MKPIKLFTRTLAAAAVGLTVTATTGCEEYRAQIVQAYPQTAPILGGRPKPTPFSLKTGNIRGFVFGADGPKQPIPLAFVSTGSISTFAGNPQEPAEEEEIDDGRQISVYHDFGDDAGPVLTERRLRKRPIQAEDEFASKYVYLRQGEFFLEEVPEGIATLKSSFGGVDSSANQVTVYPGVTVTDVALNLYLPIPVANEDKSVPRVVEWTGMKPETGITVAATIKRTDVPGSAPVTDVTITYKPDPPDVAIELKSPPGSGGTVIRSVSVAYVYTTIAGERKSVLLEPPIPISPVVVPAAQATSFGPPAIITVPVGSATIRSLFQTDTEDDRPNGMIVANLRFLDEQGFEVQGKLLEALEASVVLRAL